MNQQQAYVRIEHVTKRFDDFVAVDDVSLDVQRGEIFCLLGGSGSGKTTLLRMLAGFETPSAGRILVDGRDMSTVPPYERPVNMMFQSYALFPHMNVTRNIAFGLEQERLGKDEIRRRVGEILDIVKMGAFAHRKPHQLSGGQRQRIALARALVKRPKLLLLDEPLAALDRKLREHTQFELINIQKALGVTFIVVTHDQEEAMTLSTRMGVMNHGRIVQVGTPAQIYESPGTRFIADFIGSVNLFEGQVLGTAEERQRIRCTELGCVIKVDRHLPAARDADGVGGRAAGEDRHDPGAARRAQRGQPGYRECGPGARARHRLHGRCLGVSGRAGLRAGGARHAAEHGTRCGAAHRPGRSRISVMADGQPRRADGVGPWRRIRICVRGAW